MYCVIQEGNKRKTKKCIMLFLANRRSSGGSAAASSTKDSGSGGGGWFGGGEKKADPSEQAKEWKRTLQREMRRLDRDILSIKREEDKAAKEVKALIKKNQVNAAKILAKQIAHTRHTTERLFTTKAQMNSVCNNLQTSMSLLKMQGTMSKSVEIMGAMNKLINMKEMRETMGQMAREMERAGLIEEMMNDTLDALDDEGVEAEADSEVEKIIAELTASVLAPAGATPVSRPAAAARTAAQPAQTVAAAEQEESVDSETAELMRRLQAL